MPQHPDDPRQSRRLSETLDEFQRAEGHPQFRVDVERIRFSPYYSRLSAVTQVISQAGAGLAVHNRLTHSIKVAAVARAIATHLSTRTDESNRIVEQLGGAHPVVVQAAAAAHDLGHPPFGHLGEQTSTASPAPASGSARDSRATRRRIASSPGSMSTTDPASASTSPPPCARRC